MGSNTSNNSSNTSNNIRFEFDDLNQAVRNVSAEIIENSIAEDSLMRRNGIELLAMMTPLAAVKIVNLKTSFPIETGLMIAVPIVVLAGVSYFQTIQKRNPYQDRGIELANELTHRCKALKAEFPKAKWSPKKRCYDLPKGEKTVVEYPRPSVAPLY